MDDAEIDLDLEIERGLARPFDAMATRNGGLEHGGVVERGPDGGARRGDAIAATKIHQQHPPMHAATIAAIPP
ncbi:hypothetical protein D3C72_2111680 [compost metagenome]